MIKRIAIGIAIIMLLTDAGPMVPFSGTPLPGSAMVPGDGAMVPNAYGGTPPTPPVDPCSGAANFADGCAISVFP